MIYRTLVSILFVYFYNPSFATEVNDQQNFLSELKIYESGVPYHNAKEDWALADARLSSSSWSRWRKDKLNNLNSWIITFKDNPSFIAGWQHDYVNPTTGVTDVWRPTTPMPATTNQKYYQAWVSYARSYNIAMVLEAARFYKVTGNMNYASWAMEQIDFYATNYDSWPLRTWNGQAKMMGQSLDEAVTSMQLLESVRLLNNVADEARKDIWKKKLFYPVVNNLLNFNQGVNNIALWHASEITLTGLIFNDNSLVSVGYQKLNDLMNKGLTKDYIWYEGSFNYNYYALRALAPLIINASLLGRLDAVLPIAIKSQNMLIAPLQFIFEDNYLPTPGDSNGRIPYYDKELYLQLNRVLPTLVAHQFMDVKSWDVLLTPVISKKTSQKNISSMVKTQNFDSLQMAVLKSYGWQSFVHYGQATGFHAQEEALNFELYLDETPITVDPGTVSYGSDFHKNYFSKAYAHNVPLINRRGQLQPTKADSVKFNSTSNSIEILTEHYNDQYTINRKYQVNSSGFTDYIYLQSKIANNNKDKLGVIFNTECAVTHNSPTTRFSDVMDGQFSNDFKYWKNTKQLSDLKSFIFNLTCNGKNVALTIDSSILFNLYISDAPTTPLIKTRIAIYLETISNNAEFKFNFKDLK